ncbi:MAG: hypothetical protein WCT30_06945 [Desulfurivibrionaceae bacterium]
MQKLRVAGAVEWLVIFRQAQGLPWQRLAAILGLWSPSAPCSPP